MFECLRVLGNFQPVPLDDTHDHAELAEVPLVDAFDQDVEYSLHREVAQELIQVIYACELVFFNQAATHLHAFLHRLLVHGIAKVVSKGHLAANVYPWSDSARWSVCYHTHGKETSWTRSGWHWISLRSYRPRSLASCRCSCLSIIWTNIVCWSRSLLRL